MKSSGIRPSRTESFATSASQWTTTISNVACVRLCNPVRRFEDNSRVLLGRGQGELKYGPPRFIGTHPQPAPMAVDDGLTNRKPHPNSAGLGGVEGLENPIEVHRVNAGP